MLYILAGPIHSGKTTLLKRVVNELKRQKYNVKGFLSEAVIKNRVMVGYDLLDLKEGKPVPFIRKEGKENWETIGSYFFIPRSLERAKRIILQSKEDDLLVADEVGPLELEGRGLWPALKRVIFLPRRSSLLVMRIDIIRDFFRIAKNKELKIFDAKEKDIFSEIIKEIKLIITQKIQ